MKRFFLKNKYNGIDDEFSDGDLIFGIAIIIKEIQLHLIKDRNCQYIIQADLTNDRLAPWISRQPISLK